MSSFLCFLTVRAIGADGSDGVVFPGATPLETTASIGASVGGAGMVFAGSIGVIGGEASLRLSDRLGVVAFGGYMQSYSESYGGPVTQSDDGFGAISVRYHAVSSPTFNFAPMLTAATLIQSPPLSTVGLGAAVEGGGERVRFDLSAPSLFAVNAGFAGTTDYGLRPRMLALGAEFGLTWRLGEIHQLRFGVPAMIAWRMRSDHVYLELSTSFILFAAFGTAEVGVRF